MIEPKKRPPNLKLLVVVLVVAIMIYAANLLIVALALVALSHVGGPGLNFINLMFGGFGLTLLQAAFVVLESKGEDER